MKLIVPFGLFMAIGIILAGGCVTVTTEDTVNATAETSPASFSTTADPGLTKTINTTASIPSELSGSLRVSISGIPYPANLAVVLDNETVGTVKPTTPLYLMVTEGNHTVMVCVSSVCEKEEVSIRYGKYVNVDFSERLQRDVEFSNPTAQPTARILEHYRNGDAIFINVEFFNPSTEDLTMSAEISCGYSYIDDRTSIKMGDSVKGMLVQNVRAGQRITGGLVLYFASGHSYSYYCPVIEDLKVK